MGSTAAAQIFPGCQNWPQGKFHRLIWRLRRDGWATQANAVFVLRDAATAAVVAELRGTTAWAWRGMAPGSRKDRGFFGLPTTTSHAIVLCESAIDALSCHALHPASEHCICQISA